MEGGAHEVGAGFGRHQEVAIEQVGLVGVDHVPPRRGREVLGYPCTRGGDGLGMVGGSRGDQIDVVALDE